MTGYGYFWGKWVRGFNSRVHCARCLVGDYEPGIARDMASGVEVPLNHADGEVLYVCGVSKPWAYARNFHLALRVNRAAERPVEALLTRGQMVTLWGFEAIPFDNEAAARDFPALGPEFLTCRNFQFGAQMAADGLLPL